MFVKRKKWTVPYYAPCWSCIKKYEVTALPFQIHTVDSWAWQTCVRIKAKLFMMDDITDNGAVMGWKYGLNMQMVGVTQMVSPMEQSEAALV